MRRSQGCHSLKFPVLFYKPVTSIGGPFDTIPVPAPALEADGLDYECELVAVIGKEASEVSESNALDYVLGYAVGNDISHREWQLKRGGGQWALGKGFDGWAPMGPGIVSTSLIRDPQALNILTKVNGKIVQNSSTKDMIFGVAKTIAFLSKGRCPWSPLPRNFFLKGNAEPQTGTTLLPGDLIFTGT
jgi:2-keto-4-pentenoate hydratase/2-oxohepta-3-ene-1,7-dioic acid hydratase in catechol pathway